MSGDISDLLLTLRHSFHLLRYFGRHFGHVPRSCNNFQGLRAKAEPAMRESQAKPSTGHTSPPQSTLGERRAIISIDHAWASSNVRNL